MTVLIATPVRRRSRPARVGAGLATLALTGGLVALTGGVANAAYAPATPPYPCDPNQIGAVTIYDATSGAPVTSGSASTALNGYYFVSNRDFNPGHTRATVFGYLAEAGKQPGDFSGQSIGQNTTYPPTAAPAPVNSFGTRPVARGASTATFANLAAAYPNSAASTSDFYELYQVRVRTSFPTPTSDTYAYVDVQIDTGAGTWTVVGNQAQKPCGAPAAPSATAGDGTTTVTVPADVADGGSPITSYTITPSDGSPAKTITGPAGGSVTFTGLTNGKSYSYRETANNAIGSSPVSDSSNAVTPAAAPPAALPETPLAALLLLAGVGTGGLVLVRRRTGAKA